MLLGHTPLGDVKEASTFCLFQLLNNVASSCYCYLPLCVYNNVCDSIYGLLIDTGYFSHLKILNLVTMQRPLVQLTHCKVLGFSI